MNHRMITLCQLVVAVGIALVVPLAAQAQPVLDDFDGIPWNSMRARGPAPGDPTPPSRGGDMSWNSPGFAGPEDAMPSLPILRGLSLTEAQRDKAFAILHAQAPALRENAKVARRARDDLQRLVRSADYDQAKARSLADSGARALGTLALLRADGEHQIYALLTDEQRQQLEFTQRLGR